MSQRDAIKSIDGPQAGQQSAARPAGAGPIAGLYLHVPFCFHKCHYCDFYSLVETRDAPRDKPFTDALIRQLEHLAAAHDQPRPRTIFVGGGTPTLLPPEHWRTLLDALREQGWLTNVHEFTVEANPETVTEELAEVLTRAPTSGGGASGGGASGGVNRVSIGCQSFDEGLLRQLERWHHPRKVADAVRLFRGAGVTNINLDLIFAIPTQTMAQLDADLDRALALEPTHLSCYSLIFEPNTPLTRKLKLGRVSRVGEDVERAMYERVIDRLDAAGYEHYEVSNWARSASPLQRAGEPSPYRCAHNLIYWTSENWLAAGPSASGHLDGRRWKIAPRLGDYIARSPTPAHVDEEHLPPRARLGEQRMLRIRLREGVPLDMLHDLSAAAIDDLLTRGLVEQTATHLRLTREGLMHADTVAARLL